MTTPTNTDDQSATINPPPAVEHFINLVGIAKLLRIPVAFNKIITMALLDTGSSISTINSKMYEEIKNEKIAEEVPMDSIKISTASGGQMGAEGKVILKFKLSAVNSMSHTFYIIKEVQEDIILGLDFFREKGVTIIADERRLSFMQDGINHNHLVANIRVQDGFSDEKLGVVVKPNIGYQPGRDRSDMEALLLKYDRLFAKNMTELGKVPGVKHEINNWAMPRKSAAYRTPMALRPVLKEHIDTMLKTGVIRPSKSSYAAPVMLVPKKKKGDFRFVINYTNLNAVTHPTHCRIPLITETIDSISKSIIYSTIDLFSGFYQIEVLEKDIEKTGFITEYGLFECNRLPMGLNGSTSTFQLMMEETIIGLEDNVKVFIDDAICHSSSIEEHLIHLEQLFIRLEEKGLKMKMSKCFFGQEEVEYLGCLVSKFGVKPNPKKINDVKCFPIPRKVKQLRGFLGLSGYFRRFVENYAATAHPLTNLTKKKIPWVWHGEHQNAFETLKNKLINYPILGYPMFDRVFRITSDASMYAVGATLTQMQPSGIDGVTEEVERVIAYTSKQLSESQYKFSVIEKELFALFHATKVWHCYLFFNEVRVSFAFLISSFRSFALVSCKLLGFESLLQTAT